MAQPKQLDEILKIFYNEAKPYNITEISNILYAAQKPIKPEILIVLIRKLMSDKYLDRHGSDAFQISFDGIKFHEDGGCHIQFINQKFQQIEKREKERLEKQQIKSIISTNKSVEATNVFVVENSKRQTSLTKTPLIVAAASALFAFGSIIAELTDTTGEEVQLLRQQLQKQSQVQEQMQQYQKGIDSSMKVFLHRSDTARH